MPASDGEEYSDMGFPSIHTRQSLQEFIASNLSDEGSLLDSGLRLPDEEPRDPSKVSFTAGSLDGVIGHHAGAGQATDRARKTGELLIKAATKPTKRRLRKLYEALNQDDALDYVDPMIEHLGGNSLQQTISLRSVPGLQPSLPIAGRSKSDSLCSE